MRARTLSDRRAIGRMRGLLTEDFSEASFLESADPAGLASRLESRLKELLLAGEDEAELVDALMGAATTGRGRSSLRAISSWSTASTSTPRPVAGGRPEWS